MFAMLFSPRLHRPLFWLLASFSLVMALLPQPPSFTTYELGDKVQHMLAFAVLTVIGRLAWPQVALRRLVLLLLLYGAAIEVLQMIPSLHRDADPRDWVADGAAIALAVVFAQFLVQFVGKRVTN